MRTHITIQTSSDEILELAVKHDLLATETRDEIERAEHLIVRKALHMLAEQLVRNGHGTTPVTLHV